LFSLFNIILITFGKEGPGAGENNMLGYEVPENILDTSLLLFPLTSLDDVYDVIYRVILLRMSPVQV
jgi:hypothetical protein